MILLATMRLHTVSHAMLFASVSYYCCCTKILYTLVTLYLPSTFMQSASIRFIKEILRSVPVIAGRFPPDMLICMLFCFLIL